MHYVFGNYFVRHIAETYMFEVSDFHGIIFFENKKNLSMISRILKLSRVKEFPNHTNHFIPNNIPIVLIETSP